MTQDDMKQFDSLPEFPALAKGFNGNAPLARFMLWITGFLESRFRTDLVSASNATGIWQFLPSTARLYLKRSVSGSLPWPVLPPYRPDDIVGSTRYAMQHLIDNVRVAHRQIPPDVAAFVAAHGGSSELALILATRWYYHNGPKTTAISPDVRRILARDMETVLKYYEQFKRS
jgi:hypothetical protein